MNPDLLALHDIQPAPPPGWWPPAPGWWLLALVLAALLALAGWWLIHAWRRWRQRRQALQELRRLGHQYHDDPRTLAAALSMLLRRAALARFPPQQVAALAGASWLQFLDRTGATTRFSTGPGRVLAEAPYRPVVAVERRALLRLVRRWLRRNL